MSYRLDQNDAFWDDPYYDAHEEARTTPGPQLPRRGSLQDAIDNDYDPRDEHEEMP